MLLVERSHLTQKLLSYTKLQNMSQPDDNAIASKITSDYCSDSIKVPKRKFSFFRDLGKGRYNEQKNNRRFKFLAMEDAEVPSNGSGIIVSNTVASQNHVIYEQENQSIKDKITRFTLRKKISNTNLKDQGTFRTIVQSVKSLKRNRDKTPTNHLANLFDDDFDKLSNHSTTESSDEEVRKTLTVQNPTLGLYDKEPSSSDNVELSYFNGTEQQLQEHGDRLIKNDIIQQDEMESPYTYVFDTPNINSLDDSNNIEEGTVINFRKIWHLLSKECNQERFTHNLSSEFLLSDLSRNLLVLVETLVSEKNSVQSQKDKFETELIEVMQQNKQIRTTSKILHSELTQLKEIKQDTLQKYDKGTSIKEQNKKIVQLENENKIIRSKLENKQFLYRKLLNIFKENTGRLSKFEIQNGILEYYRQKSNNFMFSIIADFNGIVPDEIMKRYNESFNQLCYKYSLVNMHTASKPQVNAIKLQIKQFFENTASESLISNVLQMYTLKTRSNEFFQKKLLTMNDELNGQQTQLKKAGQPNEETIEETCHDTFPVALADANTYTDNITWAQKLQPQCIDY